MMIAIGNFLFRYRNALFPFVCMLVLLLPGPMLFANPLVAVAIGALIAAIGQLVRVLTIGLRYIVRGGRAGRVYADDLVTDGVYALCRNPMYVGNALLAAGVATAANSLTAFLCALLLVLFVYSAIVSAEEHYLQSRFGAAFSAYCADVPRWFPHLADVQRALRSGTFHWRRVIVKEYGTPFGWINVLCLIAIHHLWRGGTLEPGELLTPGLLTVMAFVSLLWLTARFLKKTRRLVAD